MNGKFSKIKKVLALLTSIVMVLGAMPLGSLAFDIDPEAVVYERPEVLGVYYNQIGKNFIHVDVAVYGKKMNDQPVMAYLFPVDENEEISGPEVAVAYAPFNGIAGLDDVYEAEIVLGVPDDAPTGDYILIIAPNRLERPIGDVISFISAIDVNGFFEAVNMKDVELSVIREKLDKHYPALSVVKFTEDESGKVILKMTGEDYENLSDAAKEEFAKFILNGVNGKYSHGKGEYNENNAEAFIKEAYLLSAYNTAEASLELAELIYRCASILRFDPEDKNLYGAVQNKESFAKAMKTIAEKATDIDHLAQLAKEAAAIQLVNETTWDNTVNVINANNQIFGVNQVEINEILASKPLAEEFGKRFRTQYYYSIDEVKADWTVALTSAKAYLLSLEGGGSGGSGGTGGGSTGGSGGSGGSGGNKTHTVSTQITNAQNNYDPNVEILDYYKDMAGYQWSSEAVLNLTKAGLVSGYGDKTFAPGNSLTRAEFTKMIVNVFSLADITATTSFTDVDKDAWHYIYIASAEKYGLAQGYGNGLFGVNDPITRQDAVTLIYRAAKAKGVSLQRFYRSAEFFKDKAEIAPYALDAVSTLYNAGIYTDAIEPTTVDVFAPTKYASRAYVAVVLNQVYLYMK